MFPPEFLFFFFLHTSVRELLLNGNRGYKLPPGSSSTITAAYDNYAGGEPPPKSSRCFFAGFAAAEGMDGSLRLLQRDHMSLPELKRLVAA